MKHLFVPYELALKLKEKGFDDACFATYSSNNRLLSGLPLEDMEGKPANALDYNWKNSQIHKTNITAPLYQQVTDWLREAHNIEAQVCSWKQGGEIIYLFSVHNILKEKSRYKFDNVSKTYYEGLDKAIEESLKLIL